MQTPSLTPYVIGRLLDNVKNAREQLLAIDPEISKDEKLWQDTLDGETDVLDLLREQGRLIRLDEAFAAGLKGYIATLQERHKRLERRVELRRAFLQKGMEEATMSSLPDPAFTARIQSTPRKVLIEEGREKDLPVEYVTVETSYKPDKRALKAALEAGEKIPFASLDNGGTTVVIR